MTTSLFKIFNLHELSTVLAFFAESLITFLVIMSPPSCISLSQVNLICLKEIGSNNHKEIKLPLCCQTADREDLGRGK